MRTLNHCLSQPQVPVKPGHILIADDHPLYRDALRLVVGQVFGEARISEACSESEVMQAVSRHHYDLILLDLRLPEASGYTCLTRLREEAPDSPVVIISAVETPETIRRAFECGAAGYLPKSSSKEIMANALNLVVAGGVFMPAKAMGAPGRTLPPGSDEPALTNRQRTVLALMSRGMANKEIARSLEISEITVKAHVSAILKKLGASNRVQAAMMASGVLGEEQGQ